MEFPEFDINDYNYFLPDKNIAQFPAKNRGESNILLAHKNPFSIARFNELKHFIPRDSLLIFNETKVIPARLIFYKPSGARIEIFLLNPENNTDFQLALASTVSCSWNVLIGNASKWKNGDLLIKIENSKNSFVTLTASRTGADTVKFKWDSDISFSEILSLVAKIPLPPYIQRENIEEDRIRYQTVFARNEGSVAAPTAGLHFTESQLQELTENRIIKASITLHVGLGTFRPVKGSISEHKMHTEPFYITREQLNILSQNAHKPWVVVGTTTLRALESLYIYAEKIKMGISEPKNSFEIQQWDKRQIKNEMPRNEAFSILMQIANQNQMGLYGQTSLFITKGNAIKTADYLITNFHQPKSTLLMLVDAFASEKWQTAYEYAINNNMRFLSYGDACLFKNIAL